MKPLRFSRAVYSGVAIDETVKLFAAWATCELTEEADHWVVRLTALVPANERRVAGEVANYALGLTIRNRAPIAPAPAAAAQPSPEPR